MTTALIGFAVLLGLCLVGFRIGFATLIVGFVGFGLERGFGPALAMVSQQVVSDATNYNLSVIPLFILMGVFVYRSDVSRDLYDAAFALLGRFRGGLALATVLACGGFSAVCGSTLATAATMAKVAMPPMKAFHYSDRLAAGTIAAGGTLGIMIPPSVPLVIYGTISETDIGLLFVAGILPGLLLIGLFLLAVAITVRLDPSQAPVAAPPDLGHQKPALRRVLPVLGLFALVLGGLYGAVFTATEAAGIGAVGAALIALSRGYLLRLDEWRDCLVETSITTSKIFIVVFGAVVFSQFINLSGLPFDILDIVEERQMTAMQLVAFIILIALVMGMIFDALGILLLLVPVFLPALFAAEVDMIWFGIVVVLVIEIGLITPPVGLNAFVVKSVLPHVALSDIFRGVTPFVLALCAGLALVYTMPAISTFLPDMIR